MRRGGYNPVDSCEAWAAAERFIGFIKDAPEGEPIAEEHDKYLHKSLAK